MLYHLLNADEAFSGFFGYLNFIPESREVMASLRITLGDEICAHAPLATLIRDRPVDLAYAVALIMARDTYSIAPRWLTMTRPGVEHAFRILRSTPCLEGCAYCNRALDPHAGLKRFFGFDDFRTFDGEPLQENAVRAALHEQSLLTIFPTGGGKSLTFQVPALMQGEATKGLTVVISPLQSLMKDQVDNLEKSGIACGATINGLLNPIERAVAIERVREGLVHLLYLSPEALRSPTIERLLLSRTINRFVIDEAHCFSAWGHDFRVDYLYIGDFIKAYQEKKNLDAPIPISCFTATAKPQVIDDIRQYFRDKLDLELEIFRSRQSRTNLHYTVIEQDDEDSKFRSLCDILESRPDTPSIIYVSRTRTAEKIGERLNANGFSARVYHGQLDARVKTENQNAFIAGDVPVMVATSAFGMGVDKKDIRTVIHYEISDSLENYVQEAGRAGRDERLEADCFILFREDDLNKHFILQNATRLTIQEVNQIWRAIKNLTRFRASVSSSALEIAREAGWDETLREIETRVITAIASLEEAGYLMRKQNRARVFADSILSRTAQEAIDRIDASAIIPEADKTNATRIIRNLIASKRRSMLSDDKGESRTDYLSAILGIPHDDVIRVITLMRQERILADAQDLRAYFGSGDDAGKGLKAVKQHSAALHFLNGLTEDEPVVLNIKEARERMASGSQPDVTGQQVRTALIYMASRHWIKYTYLDPDRNIVRIRRVIAQTDVEIKLRRLDELAPFLLQYLSRLDRGSTTDEKQSEPLLFSVLELKDAVERSGDMMLQACSVGDIEDALFYLNKIRVLDIDGGFLVVYKGMRLERKEDNLRIQYKEDDYKKLKQFYNQKIQQVHIVGEYARRMITDYADALQFVDDYFSLNYSVFIKKYFPGSRLDEIKRPMTNAKFRQVFGDLSTAQLAIIKDQERNIVVLAGPGSGKTRILVHKLASISHLEDVKHEQILALTFSRSAATEFKKRLFKLIGNAAIFIEIKTFHAFCFDVLERRGDLRSSADVVPEAVAAIRADIVTRQKITRMVLLVDEAQDMNEAEYALILELCQANDDLRVILVGDDDQNIFEFRGSSSAYMKQFIAERNATQYELVENYRSGGHLVEFTNAYAAALRGRLKHEPIRSVSAEPGQVTVIEHASRHLIQPLVEHVCTSPLAGTTGILTRTNEEAGLVLGAMTRAGVHARLIQSNESFLLTDLLEIRAFLDLVRLNDSTTISSDTWDVARREISRRYSQSPWLAKLLILLDDFARINPRTRYIPELTACIVESRLEDFERGGADTVLISTFHKSKGREFDQVFILLADPPGTQEDKRALYVAMTRARRQLAIHTHGQWLRPFITPSVDLRQDSTDYAPASEIYAVLTHEDVNLGYFSSRQAYIQKLSTGDPLRVNADGCTDMARNFILRFSTKFLHTIEAHGRNGFRPKSAAVHFLVYWWAVDEREVLIVLPRITFTKK